MYMLEILDSKPSEDLLIQKKSNQNSGNFTTVLVRIFMNRSLESRLSKQLIMIDINMFACFSFVLVTQASCHF